MIIDIVTLFPEAFSALGTSIIKRASDAGRVRINYVFLREFTTDRHRTVDDIPYGGGAGMVLKPEPFFKAVRHLKESDETPATLLLMTPQGDLFTQETARALALLPRLIILCSHYEGVDERVRTLADREISIGDYVLTGGEIPAMVLVDATVRLIPGVIQEESLFFESHSGGLLEFPHYTRPAEFEGLRVPDVLLSGHHRNIEKWRRAEALRRTLARRPDLVERALLTEEDRRFLREIGMEINDRGL
jgi:tRNA (guanine37-N1)-methyltransferase